MSVGVLVLLIPFQRIALRDLRRLEQDYMAAREPTACATAALEPYAFDLDDLDELDRVVEDLVRGALSESEQLHERFAERRVAPVPPISSTRDALADALDAQVALYRAMLEDPQGSRDELRVLGRSNNDFERRAARVRNLLLVGKPTGWDQRFMCDTEPPEPRP